MNVRVSPGTIGWLAQLSLVALGLTIPGEVSAQFSALRQASQQDAPAASVIRPNTSGVTGQQVNPGAANLLPLQEVLLFGVEDQHRGSVGSHGGYRLESQAEESSIKFFYADTPSELYGRRRITTELKIDGPGSAGFIYGHQSNPTRYFLFLLDANQTLRVLERGPDGFSEMINMTVEGSSRQELTLMENGAEVSVILNGNNLISISNDRTGVGAVGIATLGAGVFEFQKFEVHADGHK
jgi:hypothetical protein